MADLLLLRRLSSAAPAAHMGCHTQPSLTFSTITPCSTPLHAAASSSRTHLLYSVSCESFFRQRKTISFASCSMAQVATDVEKRIATSTSSAHHCLVKEDDRDAPSFFFESVETSQTGNNVDLCMFATENNEVLSTDSGLEGAQRRSLAVLSAVPFCFPIIMSYADAAYAASGGDLDMIYGEIGGLGSGVQVLYLAALLGLVGVASFFVVRQVLIRRELESAAKILQERVRTGEALPVEYFELGAVMLRKKFFGLAAKYLEQAIEKWDGDPQDLAQVHNALGFSYVSDEKIERGIAQYEKAVKLQPGYVVAWNNLGNVYQKKKDLPKALKAYEQALFFDPNNKIAREYRDSLKERVDRLAGVPIKYD